MTSDFVNEIKKLMVWSSVTDTPKFITYDNIELCVIKNKLTTRKIGLIYIARTLNVNFSRKMMKVAANEFDDIKDKVLKLIAESESDNSLKLSAFSDLIAVDVGNGLMREINLIDTSKFSNVEIFSWVSPKLIKHINNNEVHE